MRWKSGKRGQQTLGMPIGMIFSIFLIVVFIVIAFIAIKQFLVIGDAAKIGDFYQDLQGKVDDFMRSTGEKSFKINLPSDIEKVCFANLNNPITGSAEDYAQIESYFVYEANVFLIPPENAGNLQYKLINNIDLENITKNKNPYCVDSKGELKISRGFYDRLVLIE